MADVPLAPRASAANVSRRTVLSGMASSPLALQLPNVAVSPDQWDKALAAYVNARRASDEFVTGVLQPAYRNLNAALERAGLDPKPSGLEAIRRLRDQVTKAEEGLGVERTREDVLGFRRTHPDHRAYRNMLSRDRFAQRARRKALVEHRVFELEEQGNEFAATRCDRLRELILTPCRDAEALRIKIRLAYDELYRFEDADGLFRAIAADAVALLAPGRALPLAKGQRTR